jgi:hypothetical protein
MIMGGNIAIIPEEKINEMDHKMDLILSALDQMIEKKPARTDYTVSELTKIKGYSRATILRMIHSENIPYTFRGKDIVISVENAGRIKEKVK